MKVFLGGKDIGTSWRNKIIPLLTVADIDYFIPKLDDLTDDGIESENEEKLTCDYYIYVISPSTSELYTLVETINISNKEPEKLIFIVLEEDRVYDRLKSFNLKDLNCLKAIKKIVTNNGAQVFPNLLEAVLYLKNKG
jgi:hypothetical protein